MNVLRWGRSAYERDSDLALEEAHAHALGGTWRSAPDPRVVPDLDGVDVLVVNSKARVSAGVLGAFGGRAVLTTTSGFDHIDVAAAAARDILVGRCPLARRDAVVEASLGALIGLGKQWPAQLQAAREGRWVRGELPVIAPTGLRGSSVLLVGLGVIGKRLAEVLRALDVTVLGFDPRGVHGPVQAVTLEEGLRRCDAVSLHCSLTASSRGLLGDAELSLLQPHAVVVNTARGDSLDVDAAVARVRSGELRGLAVDVFPKEPWPALASHAAVEGVWLMPHGAGFAPDLGHRVAQEVGAALRALADDAPLPFPVVPADQI
ncbi:MAG: NAD(P)-dependent oxidoreductase [Myxococcota bacterium]